MRLNAIGLLCADVTASMIFYEQLGVDFGDQVADAGHVEADLGGGIRLMLDSYDVAQSFKPDFQPPERNHVVSLAVELATADEVDQTFASMAAQGHEAALKPFDAFWGQRYATILDPDGNQVDLYAPLGSG